MDVLSVNKQLDHASFFVCHKFLLCLTLVYIFVSRYGKIQCVTPVSGADDGGGRDAIVAFMDIKSAEKAHSTENVLDGARLQTQYSEAKSSSKGLHKSRPASTVSAPPSSQK